MKKITDDERKMPKYPKRPKKNGRPPRITQEIIDAVKNSLLIGNYFETAMACAGFHKDTGYDWLKKGAKSQDPKCMYKLFSDAVRKAEADAEARDVMVIEMSVHGAKAQFDREGNQIRAEVKRDPRLACWRLERKHPKRWGRTDKLSVGDPDGNPLTFTALVKKWESESEDDDGEEESS